jgi:hypothetical protein
MGPEPDLATKFRRSPSGSPFSRSKVALRTVDFMLYLAVPAHYESERLLESPRE